MGLKARCSADSFYAVHASRNQSDGLPFIDTNLPAIVRKTGGILLLLRSIFHLECVLFSEEHLPSSLLERCAACRRHWPHGCQHACVGHSLSVQRSSHSFVWAPGLVDGTPRPAFSLKLACCRYLTVDIGIQRLFRSQHHHVGRQTRGDLWPAGGALRPPWSSVSLPGKPCKHGPSPSCPLCRRACISIPFGPNRTTATPNRELAGGVLLS